MEDPGVIPGLGKSHGEGNSYPLQYSGLKNSMDRGAWQATVQRVTKSWTQLSIRRHAGSFYHVALSSLFFFLLLLFYLFICLPWGFLNVDKKFKKSLLNIEMILILQNNLRIVK